MLGAVEIKDDACGRDVMKRYILLTIFLIGLVVMSYWAQPEGHAQNLEHAQKAVDRIPRSDSSTSTTIVTLGGAQQ